MRVALGSIALLIAGALVGLIGAFVQADRYLVGSTPIPWGAVLVIVTLVAVIRGGAWLLRSRWGGVGVFAGWLITTVAMSATSPSGDLALSGGGRQMTYLIAGVVLGSAAASFAVIDPRPRA